MAVVNNILFSLLIDYHSKLKSLSRYNRYKENRPPLERDRDRDRMDRERVERDRIERVERSCDRMIPERIERDYQYFEGGPTAEFPEYGDSYRERQRPGHRGQRFGNQPRKDYPQEQFYQQDVCPPGNYPHNSRYLLIIYLRSMARWDDYKIVI